MCKKFIGFATILMLLVGIASMPTMAAEKDIRVILNGTELTFDIPPQNIGGRVMVPVRGIFAAIGAEVTWNAEYKRITATTENRYVKMQIGNSVMYVNMENPATGTCSAEAVEITLDVPPVLVDGITMVPLRAVAEGFDAEVSWDKTTQTVSVTANTTGTKSENQYENESLNLSFTAPEGYTLMTNSSTERGSFLESIKRMLGSDDALEPV